MDEDDDDDDDRDSTWLFSPSWIFSNWWLSPTPLKNDGVRQIGSSSQLLVKIIHSCSKAPSSFFAGSWCFVWVQTVWLLFSVNLGGLHVASKSFTISGRFT